MDEEQKLREQSRQMMPRWSAALERDEREREARRSRKQAIRELVDNGASITKAAEAVGVSRQYASKVANACDHLWGNRESDSARACILCGHCTKCI